MVGKGVDVEEAQCGNADDDSEDNHEGRNQQPKDNGPANKDDRPNEPVVDGVDNEVNEPHCLAGQIFAKVHRWFFERHVFKTSRN